MNDVMQLAAPIDLGDGASPIVMVDDEELDFELARRFHAKSGIANPFVHYADGMSFIEALEQAKANKTVLPALVLMDINMPRMSGFEVVEKMRQDESFRYIPIVSMLTSSPDPRDRERAKELGVDDYLVKPFDPKAYQGFFAGLTG